MEGLALVERYSDKKFARVFFISYCFRTLVITQDFRCILRLVNVITATNSENCMKAGISRTTYKKDSPQLAHIF